MNHVLTMVVMMITIVVMICLIIVMLDISSRVVRRKNIVAMNREVAKYDDPGWLVLIDTKHKIVGLYKDQHSVSHDRIHLGKDIMKIIESGDKEFTLLDFRRVDVDVPRISYHVLYEYKVPHETRVVFY